MSIEIVVDLKDSQSPKVDLQVSAEHKHDFVAHEQGENLLGVLEATKQQIEETLTAGSPLKKYTDADADTRDRWEDELAAAVEAEYRRRRGDLLAGLQAWLRDVWLHTVGGAESSFLPALAPLATQVGRRLSPASSRANLEAWEGTQRLLLGTNAQEALVVEVGLLRLQL